MYQESRIIFLYKETSLNPGSGDSIVGVDLPIQRERHTDFPKNQGGGVKGALRDTVEKYFKEKGEDTSLVEEIFGPENNPEESYQGALSPTELKILLFPVKSLKDVFAWIICPFVIARFRRDIKRLNIDYTRLNDIKFERLADTRALITETSYLTTEDGEIVLEDLAFDTSLNPEEVSPQVFEADSSKKVEVSKLAEWIAHNAFSDQDTYQYWINKLQTSLVVVSDEIFQHFVVNYTEVSTRHKRGETGTVENGQLWNEETLPPDTLMYATLLASDSNRKESETKKDKIMGKIEEVINELGFIQMGASETVGQGFLSIKCFNPTQPTDETISQENQDSSAIADNNLQTDELSMEEKDANPTS